MTDILGSNFKVSLPIHFDNSLCISRAEILISYYIKNLQKIWLGRLNCQSDQRFAQGITYLFLGTALLKKCEVQTMFFIILEICDLVAFLLNASK